MEQFRPTKRLDLYDEVEAQKRVSEYDQKMLQGLCTPDPYVRAGIEMLLLQRGFQL